MAELIKIVIPGNKISAYYAVNPPINHEDMYYFPFEKEEIILQGYKPEDYKIKAYYPGLRMRGSATPVTKTDSTKDGYELILEKI